MQGIISIVFRMNQDPICNYLMFGSWLGKTPDESNEDFQMYDAENGCVRIIIPDELPSTFVLKDLHAVC